MLRAVTPAVSSPLEAWGGVIAGARRTSPILRVRSAHRSPSLTVRDEDRHQALRRVRLDGFGRLAPGARSRRLSSFVRCRRGIQHACGCFGQHGDGYLRFSYANSLENIHEAIHRIRKVSERWAPAATLSR